MTTTLVSSDLAEPEDAWHWGVHVTASNLAVAHVGLALLIPCIAQQLCSFYRILFGTLYPAYASYKAVKTKNVKEYVKWMMYWIVFALFSCIETLADILMSFWCPFYYELKILFLVWLLSPATKGSSVLYRKFVHPQLNKREKEIDEFIARARDQGYSAVLQLGSKGLSYATTVVMQTALKGQATLVNHLRKSYSMTDLVGPGLLRPALHYASTLPEVDSQLEDFDSGLEEQALMGSLPPAGPRQGPTGRGPLRWQSEAELHDEDDAASHSDEPQTEPLPTARHTTHSRSKSQAEGATLRRTHSVRVSKSSSTVGAVPSAGPQGKTLHEDVSAYATMPRTKSKVTRKKQLKTM